MSSSSILKICPYSNVIIIKSPIQAYFSWWPSPLQHVSTVLMQQLRYPVFHNGNTPIKYHMQTHPSRNYISVVISSNYTSLLFTAATFLATCLMTVLQPSRYSIFHGGDTPIQLSLPWQSYLCQYLNTKTPSISYTICLYIRLVVTL